MKIDKKHIIGIIAAVAILIVDVVFLREQKIFYFILGIGVVIVVLPFVFSIILEGKKEKENDAMFLEFSRDLVESVSAGTPISKSILNVRGKHYGSLTPYVKKLANQISIGIPVNKALRIFADDVGSSTVKRAITLISEAEQAGGEIEKILESVAKSVNETEKLKKERKAAVYSLVVQGYIIFFVFIIIILVMQFKILPMTTGIAEIGTVGTASGLPSPTALSSQQMTLPFFLLLVIQGLFAGLTIGKLAEGTIKAGIKHSFIMMMLAVLIWTGANAL